MKLIANLLGGVSKVVGGVGGIAIRPLLGKLIPWALLAAVSAFAYMLVSNARLQTEVEACKARYAAHIAEDERLSRAAIESQRAAEDNNRAARAAIEIQHQEMRDAMETENARLRADLRSGARRVRDSLCATGPAIELPASGAPAPAPADKPRDLASVAGRVIGAGDRKDADYAQLLAIAISDHRTCGEAP